MPSLKQLKIRIKSVRSTRKITSAMKMVAASKLRRAQEQAVAARPYAEKMSQIMHSVADRVERDGQAPKLLIGTGSALVQLLVVFSSDRGLCGAFNGSVLRQTRQLIQSLQRDNRQVKLFVIGRKAKESLQRQYGDMIIGHMNDIGRPRPKFEDATRIGERLMELFETGQFDVAHLVFNRFKSAISQIVTVQQLIPVLADDTLSLQAANENTPASTTVTAEMMAQDAASLGVYEFEPSEEAILNSLLPKNLKVQVFKALLESAASEHGARMTAMDNATRNAGKMIKRLTLTYNRERQAYITREIIEIVSGAEAL